MRTVPSEEQVASRRPKCLGANLTSVMDERESTSRARLIHLHSGDKGTDDDEELCDDVCCCCCCDGRDGDDDGLEIFSSQIPTVRSKEQVAMI